MKWTHSLLKFASPRPCGQVSLQPHVGCRERQGWQVLDAGLDLLPTLVKQDIGCSRHDVLGVNSLHCSIIEAVPGARSSLTVSSVVPTSWTAHVICHSVQIIYWRCHLQPNKKMCQAEAMQLLVVHESSSVPTTRVIRVWCTPCLCSHCLSFSDADANHSGLNTQVEQYHLPGHNMHCVNPVVSAR